MKTRILSLILAINIMASVPSVSFCDTSGHWAESAISLAASAGVVSGYSDGSFQPNAFITRAEFAAMLCRMFEWEERAENTFSDLPDGAWYAESLLKAAGAGVLRGSDGLLRPGDRITREEAAVCIARSLELEEVSYAADYSDWESVSDWAKPAVAALERFGFMSGRGDGTFAPSDSLTRAEAATLLTNILRPTDDPDPSEEPSEEPSPGPEPLPEPEPIPDGYLLFAGKLIEILDGVEKSSLAAENFSRDERGRMSYPGASLGVDVSAWQGEIDWDAAAADGVEFAMIRAGYRGYTEGNLNADSLFERNLAGARGAGLEVGVYFYSQAITEEEAREEARFLLDLLGGEELDKPIVFDWELPSSKNARTRGLDRSTLTACARAFCEEVAAVGYEPMVYFYLSLGYEQYRLDEIADYPFWLAQYSDAPTFYYACDAWQFTNEGRVAGIDGEVDLNLWFAKE